MDIINSENEMIRLWNTEEKRFLNSICLNIHWFPVSDKKKQLAILRIMIQENGLLPKRQSVHSLGRTIMVFYSTVKSEEGPMWK